MPILSADMNQFVVIKNKLNIRNKPSADNDDTFVGFLKLNETIFLDTRDIVGTIPPGATSNLWLGDNLNRFVSKEGVRFRNYLDKKNDFLSDPFNNDFIDHTDKENEQKWKVSWGHVDSEVWKIWRNFKTKGEGVRVAVVDTGIDHQHPDLKSAGGISLVNGSKEHDFTDVVGHGTKCAGIIGGKGSFVFGVAPLCELYAIKVLNSSRFGPSDDIFEIFKSVFNHVIDINKDPKTRIDVLSISLGIDTLSPSEIFELQTLINAITRDTIIVAAVGDDGNIFETKYFPAISENVVCVGASSKTYEVLISSMLCPRLAFVAPADQLKTTDLFNQKKISDFSDSSAAAAFTSGIFALLLSYNKQRGNVSHEDLISKIKKDCFTPSLTLNNQLYGSGIINPLKFFLSNKN